jgi:TPR repeat protein
VARYGSPIFRGAIAYLSLGNFQQAIEDYKMSARLGHKEAQRSLSALNIAW